MSACVCVCVCVLCRCVSVCACSVCVSLCLFVIKELLLAGRRASHRIRRDIRFIMFFAFRWYSGLDLEDALAD